MLVHPIHCHDIYKARQKEREAEARMYRFQVTRDGLKGSKLVADLSRVAAGILATIAQEITGLPWLAGSDDVGQPKAA